MNLFIVHYHLHRGGVSRIISSQIDSLKNSPLFERINIISGRLPKNNTLDTTGIIIQELLDYLSFDFTRKDYKEKEEALYRFFKKTVMKDDIIHAHNSSLGKNPLFTHVLYRLAMEGYAIFYHCHDFAEDRPDNFRFLKQVISGFFHEDLNSTLYPDTPRTLFGVLNSFDRTRLLDNNIEEKRIHYLPNPVNTKNSLVWETKEQAFQAVCSHFSLNPAKPLMLYPVRVIQRKNIGEYLLLASLFRDRASWMVTMPPKNPTEITAYVKWKAFAKKIESPVIFEAGDRMEFNTLMHAAFRVITTSVREGFGMCFLEPWTFGTPVSGRSIPYVLSDFRKDSLQFPNLYDTLPVTWKGETKDFPDFPVKTQMNIIEKILTDRKMKETFLISTSIEKIIFAPVAESIIRDNLKIIEENYSFEKYGKKLDTIYRKLSGKQETEGSHSNGH
ncbi:MAG: hypothetical protein JXJ04_01960 [Spirochaetales bacterium]|nr:hypothetical protein [Spirochaetales bacterium]